MSAPYVMRISMHLVLSLAQLQAGVSALQFRASRSEGTVSEHSKRTHASFSIDKYTLDVAIPSALYRACQGNLPSVVVRKDQHHVPQSFGVLEGKNIYYPECDSNICYQIPDLTDKINLVTHKAGGCTVKLIRTMKVNGKKQRTPIIVWLPETFEVFGVFEETHGKIPASLYLAFQMNLSSVSAMNLFSPLQKKSGKSGRQAPNMTTYEIPDLRDENNLVKSTDGRAYWITLKVPGGAVTARLLRTFQVNDNVGEPLCYTREKGKYEPCTPEFNAAFVKGKSFFSGCDLSKRSAFYATHAAEVKRKHALEAPRDSTLQSPDRRSSVLKTERECPSDQSWGFPAAAPVARPPSASPGSTPFPQNPNVPKVLSPGIEISFSDMMGKFANESILVDYDINYMLDDITDEAEKKKLTFEPATLEKDDPIGFKTLKENMVDKQKIKLLKNGEVLYFARK